MNSLTAVWGNMRLNLKLLWNSTNNFITQFAQWSAAVQTNFYIQLQNDGFFFIFKTFRRQTVTTRALLCSAHGRKRVNKDPGTPRSFPGPRPGQPGSEPRINNTRGRVIHRQTTHWLILFVSSRNQSQTQSIQYHQSPSCTGKGKRTKTQSRPRLVSF